MTNLPSYSDFIAEKVGHRNWYTRPHPAPVKSRGREYVKPNLMKAWKAEYEQLFGCAAW